MKTKVFTKDCILENAILLAREVGFKKLSMRELAKRVGCSVMPIYSAYDSKEMLIEDIYHSVVRDLLSVKGYFERNEQVLKTGIKSPAFHRDMSNHQPTTLDFEKLIGDTLSLMREEDKLKGFSERECSRLHFDISVYITGIVERQLDKRQHFDDFEQFCVDTLRQFTDTIISGYMSQK